jgi:hypothetical protein
VFTKADRGFVVQTRDMFEQLRVQSGDMCMQTGDMFEQLRDALLLCIASTRPDVTEQLKKADVDLCSAACILELHRRTQLLLYHCRLSAVHPSAVRLLTVHAFQCTALATDEVGTQGS